MAKLASLVATTIVAAALAGSASAGVNLVNNGSFETGNFNGWTQTGNTGFNGVTCPGPGFQPDGNCAAFFGPVGSPGGISQTLITDADDAYTVNFAFQSDGGIPNFFSATWTPQGGPTQTLVAITNGPATAGFQMYSFQVGMPGTTSATIAFSFQDDPGFMFLDAVSVIPEPASVALLGIGLAGLWAGRRRSQAQAQA